jgi:hypothetical protein
MTQTKQLSAIVGSSDKSTSGKIFSSRLFIV